jgi:hypothetical protein
MVCDIHRYDPPVEDEPLWVGGYVGNETINQFHIIGIENDPDGTVGQV